MVRTLQARELALNGFLLVCDGIVTRQKLNLGISPANFCAGVLYGKGVTTATMTSTTPSNFRVLSVGSDDTLLWIRELVLKRMGYAVRSAFPSTVSAHTLDCDVVILCRSVAIEAACGLAHIVRATYPVARILRLSPSPSIHDECFDMVCDPTCGPEKLLSLLAGLRTERDGQTPGQQLLQGIDLRPRTAPGAEPFHAMDPVRLANTAGR